MYLAFATSVEPEASLYISMQSKTALYCAVTNFQVLIIIFLKIIMDSLNNEICRNFSCLSVKFSIFLLEYGKIFWVNRISTTFFVLLRSCYNSFFSFTDFFFPERDMLMLIFESVKSNYIFLLTNIQIWG
jgi:hypothetical protein